MRLPSISLLLASPLCLLALSACDKALPNVLDSGGPAPLILDLGPLVVASNGGPGSPVIGGGAVRTGTVKTVRGPAKGSGEVGGITFSFTVTTSQAICAILDPENAFIAPSQSNPSPDNTDNGDGDLFVGLTSIYTQNGTPGVSIGNFDTTYVDPLGVVHVSDNNLCLQFDASGSPGAHAGMGTVEFCTINVVANTSYTFLAQTISVVPSTDTLTEAMEVRYGACPGTNGSNVNECTLIGDNSPAAAQSCQQTGKPF